MSDLQLSSISARPSRQSHLPRTSASQDLHIFFAETCLVPPGLSQKPDRRALLLDSKFGMQSADSQGSPKAKIVPDSCQGDRDK